MNSTDTYITNLPHVIYAAKVNKDYKLTQMSTNSINPEKALSSENYHFTTNVYNQTMLYAHS